MQAARFEGHTQRTAGPHQVALADHLIELLRAQPVCERCVGRWRGKTRHRACRIEQRLLRAHGAIVSARAAADGRQRHGTRWPRR
jgi:hypothetical protein